MNVQITVYILYSFTRSDESEEETKAASVNRPKTHSGYLGCAVPVKMISSQLKKLNQILEFLKSTKKAKRFETLIRILFHIHRE
jgi:hypothetical protein